MTKILVFLYSALLSLCWMFEDHLFWEEWSWWVCLRRLMRSSGPIDEHDVSIRWKFYGRVWTVVRIVLILTLATSRCCFEDYTYVFSSKRFADILRFGHNTTVDKNLMFLEIFLSVSWDFLHSRSVRVHKMRIVIQVLKSLRTIMHVLKCGSIRVYIPTPPPPFREGDTWTRLSTSCLRTPFEDQAIS